MPALTPYPTYPTGAPPPDRRSDRTGSIASAAIGAVCLLSTVAVVAFTSDDLPSSGTTLGSAPPGESSTGGSVVPLAQLKQSFPLPPGTGPSQLDHDFLAPGERAYDVRASLRTVRAFYDQRLPQLGYTFDPPLPTTTGAHGGRVVGWHNAIGSDDELDAVGYLSLDVNYLGLAPGVVTIRVSFYE